jgi:hypothetical protein
MASISMAVHFRSTKLVRKNSAAAAVAIVLEEAGDIPEDGQGVEAEAAGATNCFAAGARKGRLPRWKFVVI